MDLPPFRLERFFARHEFTAPHHLCASDCETWTAGELLDLEPGASDALRRLPLAYTEPAGHPELRGEIAGLYREVAPDDILVFSGGEEAVYALVHACFAPGDRVAVHFPCYQSLHEIARGRGCPVVLWRAREAAGWNLDLEGLRSLRDLAGAIVNLPHNPTGYTMGRDPFRALVGEAAERGVRLISDEAYRHAELRDEDRLPAACDLSETAVSLGVVSKSFGLPGLRIGWVATRDRPLLRRLVAFKDYLTICPSAPSELLATIALRHRRTILERNRGILGENLRSLTAFMEDHADRFYWVPPTAGPVAYPGLRAGEGATRFCSEVLGKAGVLLLPGSVFDPDDDRHFRVGFGRSDFIEGLSALQDAL